MRFLSVLLLVSTVLCPAAVYLSAGDPRWHPGIRLLPAGKKLHVSHSILGFVE